MAYSGIGLPGIMCPDESVEQFARLYGSDDVGKMMIMSSTIGNPYNLTGKPQISVRQPPGFKDGRTLGSYLNVKRPAQVNDQNLKVNPRYGAQAFQGSRAMKRGGYGDHYNPSPAMEQRNPEYFRRYAQQEVHRQQVGFGYPRALQGSRATKRGGYGDHYNPSPAMEQRNPEYSRRYAQQENHHQQVGSGYPRALQGSRATKHGGYGGQYNPSPAIKHHRPEYFSRYPQQGVHPQQARQFHIPALQNQYFLPPPPGPRFPWL